MSGYDIFRNFLREEGFIFKEEDEICTFTYKQTPYIAHMYDSPYLQVCVVVQTNGLDRHDCLSVCNKINLEKYVVKCSMLKEVIEVSYEFVPTEDTPSSVFGGILDYLDDVSDTVLDMIN